MRPCKHQWVQFSSPQSKKFCIITRHALCIVGICELLITYQLTIMVGIDPQCSIHTLLLYTVGLRLVAMVSHTIMAHMRQTHSFSLRM